MLVASASLLLDLRLRGYSIHSNVQELTWMNYLHQVLNIAKNSREDIAPGGARQKMGNVGLHHVTKGLVVDD